MGSAAIHFTTNFAENLHSVNGDERQLSQVFHNVIQNAMEAVQDLPETNIVIAASNVDEEDTKIIEQLQPLSRGPQTGFVKIVVTDAGKGIPKENITKVFDPYFTTKNPCSEKGVGLGLTICYSIVKKHGGLITIHSTLGQGTSVEIYLPACEEEEIKTNR